MDGGEREANVMACHGEISEPQERRAATLVEATYLP